MTCPRSHSKGNGEIASESRSGCFISRLLLDVALLVESRLLNGRKMEYKSSVTKSLRSTEFKLNSYLIWQDSISKNVSQLFQSTLQLLGDEEHALSNSPKNQLPVRALTPVQLFCLLLYSQDLKMDLPRVKHLTYYISIKSKMKCHPF